MFEMMNAPVMYLICGTAIAFVAVMCVVFMVRAYRAGLAMGLDAAAMKRAVSASATFAVLPSIGILLGVIALSGTLGIPLPWLRLSVIGALHYETQVAEAAAEQVGTRFSASEITPVAFTTIALLMSFCICWGMIFSIIFTKRYSAKLLNTDASAADAVPADGGPAGAAAEDAVPGTEAAAKPVKKKFSIMEFGDTAMTALFIGLVSTYIASYIGTIVRSAGADGGFAAMIASGSWIELAVALVGAAAMALFIFLKEKAHADWLDNFSIAGSMILAMASAVLFRQLI